MSDYQGHTTHPERPSAAPRARRGSEICFQCRNRKVRCDGTPGGCENCRRLHFECSLSETSSAEGRRSLTQLERRRVRRACIACRDRKSKCTGSYPSCVRCLRLGIDCQYPSASRGGAASASASSAHMAPARPSASASRDARPSQTSDSLQPVSPSVRRSGLAEGSTPSSAASPALSFASEPNIDKSVIKQHIDAFFDFVHPIPCHGFLHRATLLQAWSKGTLNPRLLRAICGVTARYVFRGDIDRQHQARIWIHETEAQLLARIGEPRMSDVEAWMLVTLDHILSRRFGKMLVSMCLTARLAYILRLNHEEDRLPFLIQERRRRLMWSIYVVDTFYSSGRAEFTACSTDTIHLRLPCNERSFAMDVPVVTELLVPSEGQPSKDMGIMAYLIRVLDIRDRTQRLSLTITNHRKPLPECLIAVEAIERELQNLRASLPPTYQFDHKNFFLRAYTPSRTPFLMLHAWWHQTHCDLYRFTIPGFREGLPAAEIALLPLDFVAACRAKCLSHAVSVSRVLEMAKHAGVDIIADPCLAMCAFHSARIISRLGQPPLGDVPKTELIQRLGACAAALEEQAGMYPTTGILRGGIMDLIHDAQRTPRGSSPMRSIWEAEEAEADEAEGSTPSARAASEGREVYSKYSVTEEIRKLKFQEEDGEEEEQPQETAEGGGAVHQSVEDQQAQAQGQELSGLSHQAQMSQFGMARPGMEPQMPQHLAVPMNPFTPQPEAGMAFGSAGYDVAMTIGFDPRYQSGQPDMFMDSFWPIPAGTDWTMMNMENQM